MKNYEEIKKTVWKNGGSWINIYSKEKVCKVIDYAKDCYRVITVDEYLDNEDNYCFIYEANCMPPAYKRGE